MVELRIGGCLLWISYFLHPIAVVRLRCAEGMAKFRIATSNGRLKRIYFALSDDYEFRLLCHVVQSG